MSSSIASACCRTAPAATPPPCIAISSRGCCRRSATATVRSGWCISPFPARPSADRTAFSTTKREAERLIAESGVAFAILRPGFVVAPAAYGGSAMVRALAAFPLDLPAAERAAPFQPVAMEDIAATIAWLAARDSTTRGERRDMGPDAGAAGHARRRDRSIPRGRSAPADGRASSMPTFLLDLGARLGDLANRLGWMPPMRTTAIAELRRGVTGDPAAWMAATGIVPKRIAQTVGARAGDHSGQMVRAAVSDQGAGDREPRRCSGSCRASSRW